MFVISYRLRSQGLDLLLAPSVIDVLAAAGCVSLLLAGRELRQHFKHQSWILPRWIIEDPSRAAILLATIVTGVLVTSFEVESAWAIWPTGIALLVVSAVARGARLQQPAISEALLAVGLAVTFELMWLALLLIPLYLAIVLDQRLTMKRPLKGLGLHRFHPAPAAAYGLVLGTGLALSVAKDLWL
jgi:hypothetical protein